MKKRVLTVAVILSIASSMLFTSCIGSFELTNKVLTWNKQVSNKFVNAMIFAAFCVIPVYELTAIADILVINSIEFWSGSNPVTASTQVIDGKNSRYLVQRDKNGYTITNTSDNSTFKFVFDSCENSWSLVKDGKSYELLQYVDDNHVRMATPNNEFRTFELSNEGVMAYQATLQGNYMAMSN